MRSTKRHLKLLMLHDSAMCFYWQKYKVMGYLTHGNGYQIRHSYTRPGRGMLLLLQRRQLEGYSIDLRFEEVATVDGNVHIDTRLDTTFLNKPVIAIDTVSYTDVNGDMDAHVMIIDKGDIWLKFNVSTPDNRDVLNVRRNIKWMLQIIELMT